MSVIAFVSEIASVAALAVVLYILIQVLPRINDSEVEKVTSKLSFHGLIIRLERADEVAAGVFHKFLRRIRVVILKLDNVVSRKLNDIKKENGGKETKESPFQQTEEEKNDQNV